MVKEINVRTARLLSNNENGVVRNLDVMGKPYLCIFLIFLYFIKLILLCYNITRGWASLMLYYNIYGGRVGFRWQNAQQNFGQKKPGFIKARLDSFYSDLRLIR